MDVTTTTIPPYAWGIVGHDNFSDEWYPKAVAATKTEADITVANLNASQPSRQPGGLHDTFTAQPLGKAASTCDMTVEQFIQFVAVLRND